MSKQPLNISQKLVVVVMDLLLLVELTVAMYMGSLSHDSMTIFFLKTYVPAMLVTLVTCWYLIRKLADPEAAASGPEQEGAPQ
ncbi:MAG: hypothetical protein AB7E47_01345 [Desulfovibrionaceae bacterium]